MIVLLQNIDIEWKWKYTMRLYVNQTRFEKLVLDSFSYLCILMIDINNCIPLPT